MKYDVAIIGGGPGGYAAAIRGAQLGLNVVCIDERDTLGGTCLNVGCIPSKALLNSSLKFSELSHLEKYGISISTPEIDTKKMMAHKDTVVRDLTKGIQYLFQKNKITFLQGTAHFVDAHTLEVKGKSAQTLTAKNIIIATGSSPANPFEFEIDEDNICSSTGILNLEAVPKHLVIIGGGYIGLEMGSVWARLGAKVTVIEYLDHILDGLDHEISKAMYQSLKKQGINFQLNAAVKDVVKEKDLNVVYDFEGQENKIACDKVLVAVGRLPSTQNLNLGAIGIKTDPKGFIEVDDHLKTDVQTIFAIGDVIPGPMLAHKAEEEGIAVIETLAGEHGHVNYDVIPSVVFTHPEVACVGKTEDELKKANIPYTKGIFPFKANSRARTTDATEGFVKMLVHSETDTVLGVHIMGPEASSLIAEAALGMEYKAASEDIARTCHAHPTFSEAMKEAALSALGRAIHI